MQTSRNLHDGDTVKLDLRYLVYNFENLANTAFAWLLVSTKLDTRHAMAEFLKQIPICYWPSLLLQTSNGGITLDWVQEGIDAEVQFNYKGDLECYYTASPSEIEEIKAFGGTQVKNQIVSPQNAVEFIWRYDYNQKTPEFIQLITNKLQEKH